MKFCMRKVDLQEFVFVVRSVLVLQSVLLLMLSFKIQIDYKSLSKLPNFYYLNFSDEIINWIVVYGL